MMPRIPPPSSDKIFFDLLLLVFSVNALFFPQNVNYFIIILIERGKQEENMKELFFIKKNSKKYVNKDFYILYCCIILINKNFSLNIVGRNGFFF